MTGWSVDVSVPASEAEGALIIAPAGVASPGADCLGCLVEGGRCIAGPSPVRGRTS